MSWPIRTGNAIDAKTHLFLTRCCFKRTVWPNFDERGEQCLWLSTALPVLMGPAWFWVGVLAIEDWDYIFIWQPLYLAFSCGFYRIPHNERTHRHSHHKVSIVRQRLVRDP